MKKFLKIVLWIIIIFGVIQLIPIDRSNPSVDKNQDFFTLMKTPENVQKILKNACFDCHSYETKYPKYAYIAPVSWSVKHHINDGRKHANFSIWGTYNKELKQNILENTIESTKNRTMPLPSYIPYHPEANLNTAERKIISEYFQKILDAGLYKEN